MYRLRNWRRRSVASLTLALVAPISPAWAAWPEKPPTEIAPCADGKAAKVWTEYTRLSPRLIRLAAENPCADRWLKIDWPGMSVSDPYGTTVFLAPGGRIGWDTATIEELAAASYEEEYIGIELVPAEAACVTNYDATNGWTSFSGLVVYSDRDVREAPECGQAVPIYGADRHARAACTFDDHSAELTWKTLGRRLIKLEVHNWCSGGWAVAWWRLANGRTVGVWIEPDGSADLWKAELDGLPTDTKDGRVYLGTDRSLGVGLEDIVRPDPTKRPFYYNGFAAGDTVSCSAGRTPKCP
jgi:hypothetical protein